MKISAAVISPCSRKAGEPGPFLIQLSNSRDGLNTVIACEAKQSMQPQRKEWIASLRSQ
jgi:hypothetical protein